jgi:gamma-glutamyltranspeptidase/glutathione hydrolase
MVFSYTNRRRWESAAQRSVVMGKRGMVASSQPLATQAGLRVLLKGGNAVDAAVAMLATLSVVEPHSVGLGGDAFALIWLAGEKKLLGLNGSGRAPRAAAREWFLERGLGVVPKRGILSVTVPGALHAWQEALLRCGSMSLADLLEDALYHALEGFPVSEVIAGEWENASQTLTQDSEAQRVFLPGGRAPRPGEVFANPELAHTLETICREGTGGFYGGKVGEAIVSCAKGRGGLLGLEDLAEHRSTWVDPVSTEYRGYTVCELPPNGQGIVALEMLNILEGYELSSLEHNGPDHIHLLVEAKKAAFWDRNRWIADPEKEYVPVEKLLSKEHASRIRSKIAMKRASGSWEEQGIQRRSDTVYVSAVDGEGNAASFISSIFMHFGSGVVADGTGIVLQNRGCAFSLDPAHPNCIAPGKRPMHTIIPGMLFKDGEFLMSFGVMGGDMQPQGHVQFLCNLIDYGMNLQEAMDSPRVRHLEGLEVYLEEGIPGRTHVELEARGHEILKADPPVNEVGGGQAIYRDPLSGVLLAASDRRKDGCAMGY